MINLRGLGEDCDTNPNDPVCQAFYGTTPAFQQYQQNTMIPAFYVASGTTPGNQPGTVVTTQTGPGTSVSTLMPTEWFKTWKGVAAIGAAAAVAYYLFKKPSKSTPSPAAAAVNGLYGIFGRRRRRRR